MKKNTSQNIQAEISFFNRIAEQYGYHDTISNAIYEKIFDLIDSYFGRKILEAGCGSGSFGFRMKKRKPKIGITGIDINQKLIHIATGKKIYDKLICANLEDQNNFNKSYFDAIICPYVLHHFPDMNRLLGNFSHWLKNGGYLIIIEPNGSNFILKFSYLFRIILSKFIDTGNYASINESHKTIPDLLSHLRGYRICLLETFEHKAKAKLVLFPLNLIGLLALIQKILLRIYRFLPFLKYKGSDLIIVAQKNNV